MGFQTTLRKALEVADRAAMDCYDVENVNFGAADVVLVELADESVFKFDTQVIEVQPNGFATAINTNGEPCQFRFSMSVPLNASHVGSQA